MCGHCVSMATQTENKCCTQAQDPVFPTLRLQYAQVIPHQLECDEIADFLTCNLH